jgi:hypothetical protein
MTFDFSRQYPNGSCAADSCQISDVRDRRGAVGRVLTKFALRERESSNGPRPERILSQLASGSRSSLCWTVPNATTGDSPLHSKYEPRQNGHQGG